MSVNELNTGGFHIAVNKDRIMVSDSESGSTLLDFSREDGTVNPQTTVRADIHGMDWLSWMEERYSEQFAELKKSQQAFINAVANSKPFNCDIGPIPVKVNLVKDAVTDVFDCRYFNPSFGLYRQFANLVDTHIFSVELLYPACFNDPLVLAEVLDEDLLTGLGEYREGHNNDRASGHVIAKMISNMPCDVIGTFERYVLSLKSVYKIFNSITTLKKGEGFDHTIYRKSAQFADMAEVYESEPCNIALWDDEIVTEAIWNVFEDKMVEDIGISFQD